MCTYCKLEQGVTPEERLNNVPTIGELRDGHASFKLMLNRYIDDDADTRICELIIEQAIELSDGEYTVQEKHIPIKYCPFCGEEL
jgi:hypothetical protein